MKKLTFILLLFWTIAFAQEEIVVYTDKYALVIGANDYESQPDLSGIPMNDAVDMKKELESIGFIVTLAKNPKTKKDFKEAIQNFALGIKQKKGMALVYYSGHGVQLKGESYLLPTGIDIKMEADIEYDAYPVSRIVDALNETSNPVKFVWLDALHIACAIEAKADYFLTTDYLLIKKNELIKEINIINPIHFIELLEV
jgi:uncharacterized caspase-like protein